MPCLLTWKDKGLIREFTSELCGDLLLKSSILSQNDERFKSVEYIISDFSKVETCSLSSMDAEVSAAMDKIISHHQRRLKVALVTTNADILNLVLQYCYFLKYDTFKYEVFPSLEDAKQWCESRISPA